MSRVTRATLSVTRRSRHAWQVLLTLSIPSLAIAFLAAGLLQVNFAGTVDLDVKANVTIKTTGYRFHGTPGRELRYAGETWRIPADGSLQLPARGRHTTYTIDGRVLPLDIWPQDAHGVRDIPLPENAHAALASGVGAVQ